MVIWLIGMSNAGKTVIGQEVCKLLKKEGQSVLFLDGDIFREIMGNDLGHSLEDRRTNACRISKLCKYLDTQGVNVVFAILSIFPDLQEWNRKNIEEYYEVYIKVPFNILVERDSKGIYKRALDGQIKNVVGVDIEFPEPAQPDLVIDNAENLDSIEEIAQSIVRSIPNKNG